MQIYQTSHFRSSSISPLPSAAMISKFAEKEKKEGKKEEEGGEDDDEQEQKQEEESLWTASKSTGFGRGRGIASTMPGKDEQSENFSLLKMFNQILALLCCYNFSTKTRAINYLQSF
jgi:hypothetical protein